MKLTRITFTPRAQLQFTAEEIDVLFALSAHHYDAHCRAQSQSGGSLWGIRNRHQVCLDLNETEIPENPLDFRDIDTLAKCCEQSHFLKGRGQQALGLKLYIDLRDVLEQLNRSIPSDKIFP